MKTIMPRKMLSAVSACLELKHKLSYYTIKYVQL